MYWIDVRIGTRIAVEDYAPHNLDKVQPCNDQGCGWDVVVKAKDRDLSVPSFETSRPHKMRASLCF